MKMLVLGAGLQGCAAAHNLLQHDSVSQVTLADLQPNRLPGIPPATGREAAPGGGAGRG
jgi:saccharopine dehydrogenase-like NADP-dependent oxidoreductase